MKRGQQEIAGFVLIVVVVVVALMIFLVISVKKPKEIKNNEIAEDLLNSIMLTTTNCVINEPYESNFAEVVESCYENKKCKNINLFACDYLKDYLPEVLNDAKNTEARIVAYEFRSYLEDESSEQQQVFSVGSGQIDLTNCSIYGGGPYLADVRAGMLKTILRLCISS